MNSPLSIPFLAHSDFNQQTSRWLRDHTLLHKDLAIPLHLPTAKLREAAFPTIRQLLHNHRRAEHWWNLENIDELPCCYDWIRERSQTSPTTDQHIACAFEDLSMPTHLKMFQSANANSTYFYSQQPYYELFFQQVSQWTKQHGLPPFSDENIWRFFFNNSGSFTIKSCLMNHVSLFKKSNIFNSGSPEKLSFTMLIMNKPN